MLISCLIVHLNSGVEFVDPTPLVRLPSFDIRIPALPRLVQQAQLVAAALEVRRLLAWARHFLCADHSLAHPFPVKLVALAEVVLGQVKLHFFDRRRAELAVVAGDALRRAGCAGK